MEIVYVLTNPAMPGLIKIGMTSFEDVSQRLSQLYSAGVPFPFELAFACRVPDAEKVEAALHHAFAPHRVNSKREFFKLDPEHPIAILKLLHIDDATNEIEKMPPQIPIEDVEAGQHYSARRPPMNFTEMGIPLNAMLHFKKGDATARVISDKKVLYDNAEMSLTAATRLLLGLDYSVQPSPYWTYNGKSLNMLYEETYEQPA